MIIYKCKITNDEMFSDIYKIKERGLFYEVEGKTVSRSENFDDSLFGGNPSAEEQTDANDSSCVSGVDIVLNHKLQETAFNKKAFMLYLKGYLGNIRKSMSSDKEKEEFKCACEQELKDLLQDFKNFQFFTGESMNPDGMVGLLNYREDDTPYMLFLKEGLEIEKC